MPSPSSVLLCAIHCYSPTADARTPIVHVKARSVIMMVVNQDLPQASRDLCHDLRRYVPFVLRVGDQTDFGAVRDLVLVSVGQLGHVGLYAEQFIHGAL